jgi:hypothetical protein
MRLTDFWQRLAEALGADYSEYWADSHVIAELGGRTVREAIAAGEDTAVIWRGVHANLNLPARMR